MKTMRIERKVVQGTAKIIFNAGSNTATMTLMTTPRIDTITSMIDANTFNIELSGFKMMLIKLPKTTPIIVPIILIKILSIFIMGSKYCLN